MNQNRFDPARLQLLNNPERLADIPPDYLCGTVKLDNPEALVEIGAGTAFFSIAFLQHCNPSTIYACDVSRVMTDWVRDNVCPRYPNIVPVETEEHSVPLKDAIADLVFMINVHHELNDPLLTLRESHRLLHAGGAILIVDWKKQEMSQGPPRGIRCLPEQVEDQLLVCGFDSTQVFDELHKHFVVVGRKKGAPA